MRVIRCVPYLTVKPIGFVQLYSCDKVIDINVCRYVVLNNNCCITINMKTSKIRVYKMDEP